jgi:hypothetical protein
MMDRVEAGALLDTYMETLQVRSYEELKALMGDALCFGITGASGSEYQIEVSVFWDGKPGADLRVLASIDDGRLLSSLRPLTRDIIVGSPGETAD